jgi:site-specific recombinase XerD
VVKQRYREVLTENKFLTELNQASVDQLIEFYGAASPADVRATSKTFLDRIENSLAENKGKVSKVVKKQDQVDSRNVWLTPEQVHQYLGQIDRSTLIGIRDSALISLALCTGLRRDELCSLRVKDLYETQNDKPVVLVRQGKGYKQRAVPYGGMLWCRSVVEDWLETRTNLGEENYVFTGISPQNNSVVERELPITTITVKRRVSFYKVKGCRTIRPHDLRRTYARNLYLSGMDIERIRLNMGHSDAQTTRGYIGDLEIGDREPENIYQNPFE